MVSLFKQDKIKTFEYLYFFVMVIYMAQMDSYTSRMILGLSSPYFPFIFPIILTIILLNRHKVKFDNKRLVRMLLLMGVWMFLLFTHKSSYDSAQYSYHFFLFYSIVIAYIHVQVFGEKMLPIFEHIMIRLSLLSLILWGIYIIFPGTAAFFRSLPTTTMGNNFFYLFKWIDPSRLEKLEGFVTYGMLRNSGCSWEPGRFAIMVLLALYSNLIRNGIKFKGNIGGIILLLALASTFSTTGYIGAIVLYSFFAIRKFSLKGILGVILIIIPISFQLAKFEFMQEKIVNQLDLEVEIRKVNDKIDYANTVHESNEYLGSLGRIQAMYFELINIQKDPILGYGRNPGRSYFAQRISGNFVLTGGLLKLIGQHGIPLGIFLYFLLYLSSARLGREFKVRKSVMFWIFIISSVSYPLFTVPIFTAFWFYGIFRKEEDLVLITTENSTKTTTDTSTEAPTPNNESVLPS